MQIKFRNFYLKSIYIIFKYYNYNIIMIILMYSGNTHLNNLFDSYLMPWNYCIKCFNLQRIVHKKLLHDQSGLFCFFFFFIRENENIIWSLDNAFDFFYHNFLTQVIYLMRDLSFVWSTSNVYQNDSHPIILRTDS